MTNDAIDRAARWLQAWDGQGTHRTATEGDHAGAAWLAAEAAALGASPEFEEFTVDRLDPGPCFLEIDGARIDAIPAFDAPSTDGVTGHLGAEIAVAELSPQAVYSGEYRTLRRQGGHQALVIICTGDQPGMGLLNAEQFGEPYGAPAIHVSSEAGDTVSRALARGATARLVSKSRRTQASARNVVVTLPGRDPALPPLVVMTPRSSWWQSTAERGGGIVCWLETLRALLAIPPAGPVTFAATSGHELGHLGLDDFVARRPGCERATIWVHYGANIGAAGGTLSLMSSREELAANAAAETRPDRIAPPTQVPSGETRDIHLAGGAYLTLVGTNKFFHLPQDRWPHSVDVPRIGAIAAGAARFVSGLPVSGSGTPASPRAQTSGAAR
ncbi:MAG TPA: hypothetical protein VHW66_08495 [Stellaceae bacterium]|nr:hypothetical protein [Stellaceae bacterium]